MNKINQCAIGGEKEEEEEKRIGRQNQTCTKREEENSDNTSENDNDAIRSINHVTIVLLVLMCMSSSMPSGMDNNDELYTEGHN